MQSLFVITERSVPIITYEPVNYVSGSAVYHIIDNNVTVTETQEQVFKI